MRPNCIFLSNNSSFRLILMQLDPSVIKTFIVRLSLMQMDSQMIPNLWTSLDHGQGANYRLVETDQVDFYFKICVQSYTYSIKSSILKGDAETASTSL